MHVILEVIEGPLVGQKFQASPGTVIGRQSGDIRLPDSKASARHAIIQEDNKGQLILVDLDSSNGIIVNTRRVKKVSLIPGVIFKIGLHIFRVPQGFEVAENDSKIVLTWRNQLLEILKPLEIENLEQPILVFPKILQFKFVSGPQADDEWRLAYGPRWVGSASVDLPLFDPEAPAVAFILEPSDDNSVVLIKSQAKDIILVNGQAFTEQPLATGDTISFGKTYIQVSYI